MAYNESYPLVYAGWQSYTPVGAPVAGAWTSTDVASGAYQVIGKTINFQFNLQFTDNNGSVGVDVTLPLPFDQTLFANVFVGRDGVTNKALTATLVGTNQVNVLFYDGTYPLGSGHTQAALSVSGTYQSA